MSLKGSLGSGVIDDGLSFRGEILLSSFILGGKGSFLTILAALNLGLGFFTGDGDDLSMIS